MYLGKHRDWLPLYEAAPLRYADGVVMELVPGDVISDCIAFTGLYELALTRRVAVLARRGGLLVEVGANLGYFTLLWAAAHPENRVVAFEASPRNVEILRRNVARNGLEGRVDVVAQAAGREQGQLRFDVGPVEQTGWGGFSPDGGGAGGSIEVDVVRVDDVLADAPVALLKVDVEGADAWALEGCGRLLKRKLVREVWYEENRPRMAALGIPPGAARDFLRSVGYAASPQSDPGGGTTEWSADPA